MQFRSENQEHFDKWALIFQSSVLLLYSFYFLRKTCAAQALKWIRTNYHRSQLFWDSVYLTAYMVFPFFSFFLVFFCSEAAPIYVAFSMCLKILDVCVKSSHNIVGAFHLLCMCVRFVTFLVSPPYCVLCLFVWGNCGCVPQVKRRHKKGRNPH